MKKKNVISNRLSVISVVVALVVLAGCASYGPVADVYSLEEGKTTKGQMLNGFGKPWEVDAHGQYLWIVNRTGTDGWRTTIKTYRVRAVFDEGEVLRDVDVQVNERPMNVLSAPGPPRKK